MDFQYFGPLGPEAETYGNLRYNRATVIGQVKVKSSQELLPGIHETFLEPATGRGKARQQTQRKKLCAVCCVWSGVVSATDVAWAK